MTLAIPVLRDTDSAFTKVRTLRQSGFKGPLIVSVNSWVGGQDPKELYARFRPFGCEIYLHDHDKGLYGNFKFLVDRIYTSHLMLVALDDQPPATIWSSNWEPDPKADLTIGKINVTEHSSRGFGALVETVDASSFFSCNSLRIYPGFVFGIWRTEFIKKYWPKYSMDWLDMFILFCARTRGTVELVDELGAWIIGHSNKAPHKLNGRFHNPLKWGWQILLIYGWREPPLKYFALLREFAGKARFGLDELKESIKIQS